MFSVKCICSVFTALLLAVITQCEDDFYAMLGVSKDADNRAIRRAFKKIALQKHPDKNPDNENAHAEFVRLNRAYEVLMDEELRKKYDQFGEKGLSDDFQGGYQYQSWQFYRDNFGIYDDDVEIVTLSRADFQQTVIDSGETWFVNFYSTYCSHCHQLAPTWRKFAREMDGVLRIGAVNCAEDPMLCQSQNVMGYPSLVLYPQRIFFNGQRELDELINFAMSSVSTEVHQMADANFDALTNKWEEYASRPWVIDFCDDHDNCLSQISRRKLAAAVQGVANVATVNCFEGPHKDKLCTQLQRVQGVVFYPSRKVNSDDGKELNTLDPKEIARAVLQFLPDLEALSPEEAQGIFHVDEREVSVLVRFSTGAAGNDKLDLELKKLRVNVGNGIKVRLADCSKLDGICDAFSLTELPVWVMFKRSGGYEINYNKKTSLHDIVSFARDSAISPMVTLSSDDYYKALASGKDWIIDYFAPWCPPCQKLLYELRKLHNHVENVGIGTVDCVQHPNICQQAGVNSYPTTVFYSGGKGHTNVGFHDVHAVAEFIEDARNPSVQELVPEEFDLLVGGRPEGVIWLIDYFAPWCGPCQQLAPEFRKLARNVRQALSNVFFGTVNCDVHRQFCMNSAVNAYPTIRLFPSSSSHQPFDYPNNWWRDHGSMHRWLSEFLPSKVARIGNNFYSQILDDPQPWLVDFFAPWCGHCIQFAPVFERIADMLDGKVKLGKVNCDQWPGICHEAMIQSYPTVRLYIGATKGKRQSIAGVTIQSQHAETVVKIVEQELSKSVHLLKTEL